MLINLFTIHIFITKIVTGFGKTVPNRTKIEIHFIGLLLQAALC